MDAYPTHFGLGERYSYYAGPEVLEQKDIETVRNAVILCPAIAIRLTGWQE